MTAHLVFSLKIPDYVIMELVYTSNKLDSFHQQILDYARFKKESRRKKSHSYLLRDGPSFQQASGTS